MKDLNDFWASLEAHCNFECCNDIKFRVKDKVDINEMKDCFSSIVDSSGSIEKFIDGDTSIMARIKSLDIRKDEPRDLAKDIDDIFDSIPKVKIGGEAMKKLAENKVQVIINQVDRLMIESGKFAVFNDGLHVYDTPVWKRIAGDEATVEIRRFLDNKRLAGLELSMANYKEIYALVKTAPEIMISIEDDDTGFLSKAFHINCADGVIDVLSERVLNSSSDYGFFTYINVSVEDIGEGTGYYFEKFVKIAGDNNPDFRRLLLELVGVTIANINCKKFFLMLGPTNTGKSQMGKFLQKLVGDDFQMTISDVRDFADRWTTGSLYGKRLCTCMDISNTVIPAEVISVIKQFVGDDRIKGEKKYQHSFSYDPEQVLLLASNHALKVSNAESERAFIERMIILPFKNSVSPGERIPELYKKLYKERGYIIAEACKALRELADRNFEFTEILSPYDAICRDINCVEPDGIEEFLDTCCEVTGAKDDAVVTRELYFRYQSFCEGNCIYPKSFTAFSRSIASVFDKDERVKYLKSVARSGQRGYQGIRIV